MFKVNTITANNKLQTKITNTVFSKQNQQNLVSNLHPTSDIIHQPSSTKQPKRQTKANKQQQTQKKHTNSTPS